MAINSGYTASLRFPKSHWKFQSSSICWERCSTRKESWLLTWTFIYDLCKEFAIVWLFIPLRVTVKYRNTWVLVLFLSRTFYMKAQMYKSRIQNYNLEKKVISPQKEKQSNMIKIADDRTNHRTQLVYTETTISVFNALKISSVTDIRCYHY